MHPPFQDFAWRNKSWRDSTVLNAFRHHGVYRTLWGIRADTIARMCSTPFGITEYIGRRGLDQLLVSHLCSTPFGITEYIGCG